MTQRIFTTLAAVAVAACALAGAHKITAAKAAKIAQAKFHGKLLGTPKIEHEDGVWQYEVLLQVGKKVKEVNVNADTGKIGSVEDTSPAEEAREKKAEKSGKKEKPEKGEKGDKED